MTSSTRSLAVELTTAQLLVETHLQAAARWNAAAEDANRQMDGARVRDCRVRAAAAKALAGISVPTDIRILDIAWVGEALIVAYRQPSSIAFEFAVDAYRLPTPDELDVDQTDPRTPGEWILVDQLGDHSADTVPGMLAAAATLLHALFPLQQNAA